MVTEAEIKSIVHEVLAEQKSEPDEVVIKTIAAILNSFGIDDDDRKEIRADFQHLRRWRKATEQATSLTFKAVVTTLVTGTLAALWIGIRAMIGK